MRGIRQPRSARRSLRFGGGEANRRPPSGQRSAAPTEGPEPTIEAPVAGSLYFFRAPGRNGQAVRASTDTEPTMESDRAALGKQASSPCRAMSRLAGRHRDQGPCPGTSASPASCAPAFPGTLALARRQGAMEVAIPLVVEVAALTPLASLVSVWRSRAPAQASWRRGARTAARGLARLGSVSSGIAGARRPRAGSAGRPCPLTTPNLHRRREAGGRQPQRVRGTSSPDS